MRFSRQRKVALSVYFTLVYLIKAIKKYNNTYKETFERLSKRRMNMKKLTVAAMIVLYMIFQKQFIEGIATSGGKL